MKPIIVAHRGASGDAPENTLAAFDEAHRQGATMIELDVQESADGEVIVFHDDQLTRATNVADVFPDRKDQFTYQFQWSELQALDARRSLEGYAKPDNTKIPSLRELLEWLNDHPDMSLNIELKSLPRLYKNLVKRSVDLVNEFGVKDRILFSSFNHRDLRAVKDLDSKQRTAVLCADLLVDFPRYAKEVVGADAINPGAHLFGAHSADKDWQFGRDLMTQATSLGLETYVWTINNVDDFAVYAELGVTGIITDYPARARKALA